MKNVILDVDGTLWDTTEVVAKAWNRAILENGTSVVAVNSAILKEQFGKTMNVIANNLFHDTDNENRENLMKKCCQYEHDDIRETQKTMLYPNVKETIKKLSEKCGVFIVSNCQSGYIELFMKKAGIEGYITDYECFGNTGLTKGENIKLVVERNNLTDVMYVGDTLGDYEAAKISDVPFVFAKYGFGTVENFYHEINEIKELLDLCEDV
ncbi:HAD family hydrolase [Clostridium sp. SHJSY1]|uniref:HAD family hydrolase n=1 Tax=Clostridium sp. SHJSY1 TaxID=2942483 RepID=UPI00287499C8|nr:HAD family hydrolase [Clostridium sp. SHJSY1]MDS0524696.1 HAD family hydrolase [Clostridium sp. SHJSY1]